MSCLPKLTSSIWKLFNQDYWNKRFLRVANRYHDKLYQFFVWQTSAPSRWERQKHNAHGCYGSSVN